MALACTLHGFSSHNSRPMPSFYGTETKLIFDNESKIYRPGEIISGTFIILSTKRGDAEINGLLIKLEGHLYMKDHLKDSKETKKIVSSKKYFLGKGTKKLGPLKEGEYKFSVNIPEDAPCSFVNGKFGWIKYTVKCVGHQSIDGYLHIFEEEDVILIAKKINGWKNQKFYLQPMFAQRQVSSFMVSGKIHLWLNTDQKCYQPGDDIRFVLKVRNGGGKNVKGMTMQLQQVVTYALDATKQTEKIIMPEVLEGPSVPCDAIQTWNASFKIPSDLQPSIQDYAMPFPISFQYYLRVTLQMAGSLIPNINEEFTIQIGCPLLEGASSSSNSAGQQPSFDQGNFLAPDGGITNLNLLGRRMSMVSLAPSLPDYDTAMSRMRSDSGSGRNGFPPPPPPPSYSCVDFKSEN